MKVLITGASGFLGKALVNRLGEEHEVIAASRSGILVPGASSALHIDLRSADGISALPSKVDAVVHLAAVIDESPGNKYMTTNVTGTSTMLRYAERADVGIFVHGSTGGIYGPGSLPFVETDPMRPVDDYAISKAQAEIAVEAARLPTVRLRYAFPYGCGTPNPLSKLVRSIIEGRPVDVISGMRPRFNPIHVDDAIELTARCLTMKVGHCLNIAGTELATFADFALIAGEASGQPTQLRWLPLETAHPFYRGDCILDSHLAYEQLNYIPHMTLREGIYRLVEEMSAD